MRGLSEHSNARSYWTPTRAARSRLLPLIKREVIVAYKKDFSDTLTRAINTYKNLRPYNTQLGYRVTNRSQHNLSFLRR